MFSDHFGTYYFYSPFVSSRAAGKFIEESNWLARFVASFSLSTSLFTSSVLLTSYAAIAWWTVTGTNEANKSGASALPNLSAKGVGLATAAFAMAANCRSSGILLRK